MGGVILGGELRRVDPALREKYDVRGPRYTSYPPANHFDAVDPAAVLERWRARNGQDDDPGLSLYLHVPFCRSRCLFCACHTYTGGRAKGGEAYVRTLIEEMRLVAEVVDPARPVRQLALGGGTPNFLSVSETDLLLDALAARWRFADGAERSVELDPRTATPGKLDAFLRHGFNRFSLGVQDFAPDVIARLRRGQDQMHVAEVVEHLRAAGVQQINFDLIYGLPGQTLATAADTAAQALALRPSLVALYSYAHVPWLHAHQRVLDRWGLPDPDTKAELFHLVAARLVEAGYEAVGMDHFALPDDPLAVAQRARGLRRNFMGYTTGRGLDLVAFGASAISSIGTAYAQNEKELEPYQARVAAGELPLSRGYLLSRDDEIRRELLLELFCNFHVDLNALSARFDIDAPAYFADDLARLAPMVEDHLVELGDGAVEVTEPGRFFIRNVCMTFDRHLGGAGGERPVYSRTV